MLKKILYLPWLVWAFYRLITWKLSVNKQLDVGNNHGRVSHPKFMSAAQAATLIDPGSVLIVATLGGTGWATAMFQAIAKRFRETDFSGGLTVLAIGGQGGRGMIPWSIDELSRFPGLVKRFFSGHLETFRHTLKAAARGEIEVQCIPQGAFSRLIGMLAEGKKFFRTAAGIGTFADPRCGIGTCVANATKQWVEVTGHNKLRYTCPDPNVAIICATAVDKHGNVYVHNNALLGEMRSAVLATKRNGGKVIVQCGRIIEYCPDKIYIKAELVDAVVVRPEAPQVICFTMNRPFRALTVGSRYSVDLALAIVGLINRVAGVTPKRGPQDDCLARAAAWLISRVVKAGSNGNIGVGMPEVVAAWLARGGVMPGLNMIVESGPRGGVATSGVFFGDMIGPKELVESWVAFKQIEEELDFAVLGALEVDQYGNVNLSRRGEGPEGFVGPGGSTHIMHGAKTIVFVLRACDKKSGKSRFVEQVQEVTFSAEQALKAKKEVYYVTDCGIFQLTAHGLQLTHLMPGFTVEKIQSLVPFKFQVSDNLAEFGHDVATGQGFAPKLAA